MNYSTSNWNLFSRYYLINWFKIWYWWTESHDLVRFILLCFKSLRMSFQLIALLFSSIICPSYVGSKNLSKLKFQNYWFLHYLAYVLGRWDTGFGGGGEELGVNDAEWGKFNMWSHSGLYCVQAIVPCFFIEIEFHSKLYNIQRL